MARSSRDSRVSSTSDSSAVCLDLNLNDSGRNNDNGGEPMQLSISKTHQNDMLFVDLTLRRVSILETSKGAGPAPLTTTTTATSINPSWSACLPIYA